MIRITSPHGQLELKESSLTRREVNIRTSFIRAMVTTILRSSVTGPYNSKFTFTVRLYGATEVDAFHQVLGNAKGRPMTLEILDVQETYDVILENNPRTQQVLCDVHSATLIFKENN